MGKKKRPALKAGKSSTRSISDQIVDSLLETFAVGSAHDSRRYDASLEDVEHFDDANSCDSDSVQPPVVLAPSKSERKKTAAHLSEELPQPNRQKVTLAALGELFQATRGIMAWLGDC